MHRAQLQLLLEQAGVPADQRAPTEALAWLERHARPGEPSDADGPVLRVVGSVAPPTHATTWPSARLVALDAVHLFLTAEAGLPPTLCGVRRGTLIRWDAQTTTWSGSHVETGRPALLRVGRPSERADALSARRLQLDAAWLAKLDPRIRLAEHDELGPVLLATELGPPLADTSHGGAVTPEALASLVGRSLAGLVRAENLGLGPGELDPEELRDEGDRVVVVRLTPHATGDAGPVLSTLASRLRAWWNGAPAHPIADLLDALIAVPPSTFGEAAERLTATLAEVLAEHRHQLVQRQSRERHLFGRDRLETAVLGLAAAVPPPEGRGALGVGLDGKVLLAVSDGETVHWGPVGAHDDDTVLYDPDGGLDVQLARRLVHTRGSAPISQTLNDEVEGDPAFADHLARWVAATLELRATTLMLGVEPTA